MMEMREMAYILRHACPLQGKFEPPPRTEVDQWHAETPPESPGGAAEPDDEPLLDVGSDGPREWSSREQGTAERHAARWVLAGIAGSVL